MVGQLIITRRGRRNLDSDLESESSESEDEVWVEFGPFTKRTAQNRVADAKQRVEKTRAEERKKNDAMIRERRAKIEAMEMKHLAQQKKLHPEPKYDSNVESPECEEVSMEVNPRQSCAAAAKAKEDAKAEEEQFNPLKRAANTQAEDEEDAKNKRSKIKDRCIIPFADGQLDKNVINKKADYSSSGLFTFEVYKFKINYFHSNCATYFIKTFFLVQGLISVTPNSRT